VMSGWHSSDEVSFLALVFISTFSPVCSDKHIEYPPMGVLHQFCLIKNK
jgi:hypothetical protein